MKEYPVSALLRLFSLGQCRAVPQLEPLLRGLAHPAPQQNLWSISQKLLKIRSQLSSDEEAVAAILATDEAIRKPWLSVMAGRVKEAGKLSNPDALVQLVTRLGPAAIWVEPALPSANIAPTEFKALEQQLLGAGVEQSQSLPIITRVLAAAAQLTQWQPYPLSELAPVDNSHHNPEINWVSGRLLSLPEFSYGISPLDSKVVSKQLSMLLQGQNRLNSLPTMEDIVATPWAFLLCAIVYAQDSWAAEQTGGLLLELPAGQQPTHPAEIQVLVEDSEGVEILCGTLAELVLRTLGTLGLALFPRTPDTNALNAMLSPMVQHMLEHKLWRFNEGLSGEQGYYTADPDFADRCYEIEGSRLFGRLGRHVWEAVRKQAGQWRKEKQSGKKFHNNSHDRVNSHEQVKNTLDEQSRQSSELTGANL